MRSVNNRVSAGLWRRCPICFILLRDASLFITHMATNHDNTDEVAEGASCKINELESAIFHTANGILKMSELPTPELFVPKVHLIPLESTYKETLIQLFLPFICLPFVESTNNFSKALSSDSEAPEKKTYRKKTRCQYCQKWLQRWRETRRSHYEVCPLKPEFFCDDCSTRLPTAATLASHKELHHNRPKQFKCSVCSAQFATLRGLKKHCRYTRCKNLLTKDMQVKMAATAMSLSGQIAIVKTEEQNMLEWNDSAEKGCPYCKRVLPFGYETRRREHIEKCRIESQKAPIFACMYSCPARLRSIEDRAQHVRIYHQGQLPYACEFCNKPEATLEMLNRHLSRTCLPKLAKGKPINKYSPYTGICAYCQAFFPRKSALKEHLRNSCLKDPNKQLILRIPSHHKIRCYLCGKVFSDIKHLRKHITNVCSRKYGGKAAKVTERKVCDCGTTFAKADGLRRHQKFTCRLKNNSGSAREKTKVKSDPVITNYEPKFSSNMSTFNDEVVQGCSRRNRRARRDKGFIYDELHSIDDSDEDFFRSLKQDDMKPERKYFPYTTTTPSHSTETQFSAS